MTVTEFDQTAFSAAVEDAEGWIGKGEPLRAVRPIEALHGIGIKVWSLHHARDEEGIAEDCSDGNCDHDGECPTVTFKVCGECSSIASPDGTFDDLIPSEVMWPCSTIRALIAATT